MNPNQNRLQNVDVVIEESKLNDTSATHIHDGQKESSEVPKVPKFGRYLLAFVGGVALVLVMLIFGIRYL